MRLSKPPLSKIGGFSYSPRDKMAPPLAAKAEGVATEHTDAERTWLEAAVKSIIRRAAEVAHDLSAQRSQITMADLPPLT